MTSTCGFPAQPTGYFSITKKILGSILAILPLHTSGFDSFSIKTNEKHFKNPTSNTSSDTSIIIKLKDYCENQRKY